MYDAIIIGAGPSGLSASIYLSRANKKVLVLEAKSYGGQIINTLKIDNYPACEGISGFDFATNLYNQALNLGSEIKFEKVISIKNNNDYKEAITSKNTYKSKAIIIATGASSRKLNIDNEEKFTGKGVSYCATCDGAFFKNKDVMVIGGGNTAVEDALYLSDLSSKVYLILRREAFRADESKVVELKSKNNVEIIYNSTIKSINGTNTLESVSIVNKDNKESVIKVSGLFVAIGMNPENELFKDFININESGYVISGEDCHTNVNGFFVCGDIRNKSLRQLVTATSDGAIAASEAIKYINNLK